MPEPPRATVPATRGQKKRRAEARRKFIVNEAGSFA
jgi:hypothetical protein